MWFRRRSTRRGPDGKTQTQVVPVGLDFPVTDLDLPAAKKALVLPYLSPTYARLGSAKALWPLVLEKAFASLHDNGYQGLMGGQPGAGAQDAAW